MSECGVYRVLGRRAYRGHPPGTEFPARLDPQAERRAIDRGSIERIGSVVPKPGHFIFPDGWLEPADSPTTEAAEAASLIEGRQ